MSAQMLDRQRLGKQRVEGMQLLNAITRLHIGVPAEHVGWSNHPAIKMWRNPHGVFMPALIDYTQACIDEWVLRGFKNTISLDVYRNFVDTHRSRMTAHRPHFSDAMYESHRCRLAQKKPEHYVDMFTLFDLPLPDDWQERGYVWEYGSV